MTLGHVMDDWLDQPHLARRISPSTAAAYRRAMARVGRAVDLLGLGTKRMDDFGEADLTDIQYALASMPRLDGDDGQPNSPGTYSYPTVDQAMSALSSCLRWAQRRGLYDPARPTAVPKLTRLRPQQQVATTEEVEQLAKEALRSPEDTILVSLVALGLRFDEVRTSPVRYYAPEPGQLRVDGKGSRTRTIFVPACIGDRLGPALREAGRTADEWMLGSSGSGPPSKGKLARHLSRLHRAIGIPERRAQVHPYRRWLRSYLVHTARVTESYVDNHLGHAPQTTGRRHYDYPPPEACEEFGMLYPRVFDGIAKIRPYQPAVGVPHQHARAEAPVREAGQVIRVRLADGRIVDALVADQAAVQGIALDG